MKRTAFAAFAILVIVVFAATGAEAKPSWAECTGCHYSDSAVNLEAAFQTCNGSTASYALSISTPHSWKENYAVFDSSGSNIQDGNLPATISLAEGQTYTIYGVTNRQYQDGTDTVTLTPSCGPVCTDGDGDNYYAEPGCGTAVDCNDGNASINPGADEVCGDGIDNNCSNAVDEGCVTCTDNDADSFYAELDCGTPRDCNDGDASINPAAAEVCGDGIDNNCSNVIDEGCVSDPGGEIIIEILDESGAVMGSETPGDCGKATFENLPAGTYYAELAKDETHYARLQFSVSAKDSPARVIARAETEDEDDEASLKLKIDVFSMDKPEKIIVRKLRGKLEWKLEWLGSDDDLVLDIVGIGVENLESVTFRTAHGTLDAYRLDVEDKRNKAEALFKKSDLIRNLVPDGAEDGDYLWGKLNLVTPGNEKVYRFRVKLDD